MNASKGRFEMGKTQNIAHFYGCKVKGAALNF